MSTALKEKSVTEVTIDAMHEGAPLPYRILNELIHNAHDGGAKIINIMNVYGQRFICAGMEGKCTVNIHGTPGNDLGVFMEGPTINVFGSAEDQAGNTMNAGSIVVHGNAWDVTGLAARGGSVFVRGNGGYRIGIHMKEYKSRKPVVIYGGVVKEFFGEYMAGGALVALGMEYKDGEWTERDPGVPLVRGSLATGIHGGAIFLRGDVDPALLGVGAGISEMTSKDQRNLKKIVKKFCSHFKAPEDMIMSRPFTKIAAGSARPFANFYCPNPV